MNETPQNEPQLTPQPQEPQRPLSDEEKRQQEQNFYAFQRELLRETIFILDKLKPNVGQEVMRTGELSRRIGEAFGITDDEFYLAGFYANIGLLGIESYISDEKRITKQDYELITRHPTISYEVLKQKGLERAAQFVLYHHEKPNGLGYYKKTSAMYPKECAFINIADRFQNYIAHQIYRPRFAYSEAVNKVLADYKDYLLLKKEEVELIETILKGFYENP